MARNILDRTIGTREGRRKLKLSGKLYWRAIGDREQEDEAVSHLDKWRREKAADRAAWDEALGLNAEPEPTPEAATLDGVSAEIKATREEIKRLQESRQQEASYRISKSSA
jgi:hypothetical protein